MWFNITQTFDINKPVLFKVHIPFGAGIGNTLKGFISGLSINPNTKLSVTQCTYWVILIQFLTQSSYSMEMMK